MLPFKDSSSTNQATGMQPYMNYHSLDVAVGYFAAALASSTHSTYKTAERRYFIFLH